MHRLLTLALVFGALVACGGDATDDKRWPTDVVRIAVSQDGGLYCNDGIVTLDELATILKDAAAKDYKVWYYREAAQNDMPPIAKRVLDLVIENQITIKLCSKLDFSE